MNPWADGEVPAVASRSIAIKFAISDINPHDNLVMDDRGRAHQTWRIDKLSLGMA
jgi:hypothetical protein